MTPFFPAPEPGRASYAVAWRAVLNPSGSTTGQILLTGVAVGSTTIRANASGLAPGTLGVSVTQNVISTPALLNVALGQTTALPISIGPSVAP